MAGAGVATVVAAVGEGVGDVHVVRELLQVRLLLGQLLLQLEELFLLALADGVVLVGLLALLERVARNRPAGRGSLLAFCSLCFLSHVCVCCPPRNITSHI